MQGSFKEKILKIFENVPKMDKMGFLSSFFKTTEEDYTDAEFIDLDIVRGSEEVAPVIRNLGDGAVTIADDVFTGKSVKPPVYVLDRPVNIFDLMKRQPGENEYAAIGTWYARLFNILKRAFVLMFGMLKRSVELQASQVLQTGTITLTDDQGKPAYTLDFKPKDTHIKEVTTKWDQAGADPIEDLRAVMDAIRTDGFVEATTAIMGAAAFDKFISNDKVLKQFEKDKLNLGALSPRLVNKGAKYQGYLEMGAYRLDIFTYNGRYQEFGTKAPKKFVDDDKVIILADVEDLDFRCVYGGVPSLGMDAPFTEIVPETVTYEGGIRFHNRAYKDQKKNTYTAETTVRPICIPVSIDRFGCLTVL